MANHEIIYTCNTCGKEFDARLYGAVCPHCQAVNATPARYGREVKGDLFYIPSNAMLGCGFSREIAFDRDHCDFDNFKIITYTKPIAEGLVIQVVFFFEAKIKGLFELRESNVDLVVTEGVFPLGVKSLADIIRISDSLIKSIKFRKYAARCC